MRNFFSLKRIGSWLPFLVALCVFFLNNVPVFELTGRLQEQLPVGWRTHLFIGRLLIIAPMVISLPACWARYKWSMFLLVVYSAVLLLDTSLGTLVFETSLIHLLWEHITILLLWLISFAVALKYKANVIATWWPMVVLMGAVLGGGFYKYKIYQPDLLAVPSQQSGLIPLNAFKGRAAALPEQGFILLYSSGCTTCYKLAKAWRLEAPKHSIAYVQFVMGTEEQIENFKSGTNNRDLKVLAADSLLDLSGPSVPVVYQIEAGKITKKWVGDAFSYPQLDALAE